MMFRGLILAVSALMGGLALTITDAPQQAATVHGAPSAVEAGALRVAADATLLRDAPGYQSRPTRQVEPGRTVELVGLARDGWVEVRLPDGAQGYVMATHLTKQTAAP